MLTIPAEVAEQHAELIGIIDTLVERHGRDRSALIPVLQDLHVERRRIGPTAMQVVADRLGIPVTDVYGVVTFYSFLGMGAVGRHVIRLCRTISCGMAGAEGIARHLERELGIGFGETTPDGLFTLEWANCIGRCDSAPAMLVDQSAMGHLTPELASEVIAGLRAAAREE